MKKSRIILTDSGEVQEEAPSLGKPVLVMRDITEKPEGVEVGTARLVGTDAETIISQVELLLNDHRKNDRMAQAVNPYGDGKTSEKILAYIKDYYFSQLPT
jgi:UDP-N-acetylglucosamine 2-epimerase (non-hydrolysing)